MGASTGMQAKALFKTTNGGSSWDLQADACPIPGSGLQSAGNPSCAGNGPHLQMLPNGYGWLWTGSGTIQSTSDGGREWRPIGNKVVSLDLDIPFAASLVSDNVGELLVFASPDIKLSGTRDGGSAWQLERTWLKRRAIELEHAAASAPRPTRFASGWEGFRPSSRDGELRAGCETARDARRPASPG
jgi:photosystem II stability/assembly factor-like uncharacterized protein